MEKVTISENVITNEDVKKELERKNKFPPLVTNKTKETFPPKDEVDPIVKSTKEAKEKLSYEKLSSMNNREFLSISHDRRLENITKGNIKSETLKDGDSMEFTFTFDGVYNRELFRKTTAGQVLPETVSTVMIGKTKYEREGLNGEFFRVLTNGTVTNSRLIIREGTDISLGKLRNNDEINALKERNSNIQKAYLGELGEKEISKLLNEGENISKYKLSSSEKEDFKEFPDIVSEAISRGIEPKFAVLAFSDKIKNIPAMDRSRSVLIEEMFTEFSRKKALVSGTIVKNSMGGKYTVGKYTDELAIRTLKEFGGDNWIKKADLYGIKPDRIKVVEKQIQSRFESTDLGNLPSGIKGLLHVIAGGESNGNYNAIVGNARQNKIDFTSMTVYDILKYQRSKGGGTAIGRYQFIHKTLHEMVQKGFVSGNEIFDESFQDKIAIIKLKQRGLNDFMSGRISRDTFQKNLSMEWAAIAKDSNGQSYYKGVGNNAANISNAKIDTVLDLLKSQGYAKKEKTNENLESNDLLKGETSLTLRFIPGKVDSKLSKLNESMIRKTQTVFIFRDEGNLSGSEMKKISDRLTDINPNLKIFIDQEGGKINRFKDFDNKKERGSFLKDTIKNSGIKNKEEIAKILEKNIGRTGYPSLAKLGEIYNSIKSEDLKSDYLKAVTYLRLKTLKERGVNTYGLVADLDYGNKVISGDDRSFSKNEKDYEKFGKSMIDNAKLLGMTVYLKHFPGHGAGNVDTHEKVLNYSKLHRNYLKKNISLFENLVDYGKGSVGLMVGHMFIPNEFKVRFDSVISKASYVLTDDLGMGGFTKAQKELQLPQNKDKFFTTNSIKGDIIKVQTEEPKGVS